MATDREEKKDASLSITAITVVSHVAEAGDDATTLLATTGLMAAQQDG